MKIKQNGQNAYNIGDFCVYMQLRSLGFLLALLLIVPMAIAGCDSGSTMGSNSNNLPILRINSKALVQSVAFSSNGKWLAAGTYLTGAGEGIWLWRLDGSGATATLATPAPVTMKGHTNDVNSVTFSADSQVLVSGSDDDTVRLWNVNQPSSLPLVLTATARVKSVAFSPDSALLAAGTDNGQVAIWHLDKHYQPIGMPSLLYGSREPVLSVAFSPDGRSLAAASHEGSIYLWENTGPGGVLSGVPKKLVGHTSGVTSVAFYNAPVYSDRRLR